MTTALRIDPLSVRRWIISGVRLAVVTDLDGGSPR